MLCELAEPYGPLFAWLDARLHDEGPQPWESLQGQLSAHPHADFALGLMARMPSKIEPDSLELDHILTRERQARVAEEMQALSQRAGSDPSAYERLKELVAKTRDRG
jgi:DNA primase